MGNNKTSFRGRLPVLVFILLLLVQTTGCASALLAPIWLIKGGLRDPEFKKQVKEIPKESRMIVVCRSGANLYGSDNPSRSFSNGLTYLLSTNISSKKKLKWLSYDLVEDAYDEKTVTLESFAKIGQRVGADYIFGVDIDSFNTQISSQFYQGRSKVHVQLINVETGAVVARKTLPEYVYPPNPVPINNKHESEFQKQFIVKLASEVGRLFYPHDPHDRYALDNDFPER